MASSCKVGDFGQRQSSLCFIPYVEWDYVHFDSYHVLFNDYRKSGLDEEALFIAYTHPMKC